MLRSEELTVPAHESDVSCEPALFDGVLVMVDSDWTRVKEKGLGVSVW